MNNPLDLRAGATDQRVFLQRDDEPVLLRELDHQRFVQWLGKAHIGHAGVELVGNRKRRRQHGAESEQRGITLTGTPKFAATCGGGCRSISPRCGRTSRRWS